MTLSLSLSDTSGSRCSWARAPTKPPRRPLQRYSELASGWVDLEPRPRRDRELWSNSRGIAAFRDPRPLTAAEKSRLGGHTLVRRHVDPGTGKRRFTGKRSSLKASGCLDYYTLHTDCIHGPCGLPRIVPSLQTATAAKAVPIPVWTTLRQGFSHDCLQNEFRLTSRTDLSTHICNKSTPKLSRHAIHLTLSRPATSWATPMQSLSCATRLYMRICGVTPGCQK